MVGDIAGQQPSNVLRVLSGVDRAGRQWCIYRHRPAIALVRRTGQGQGLSVRRRDRGAVVGNNRLARHGERLTAGAGYHNAVIGTIPQCDEIALTVDIAPNRLYDRTQRG